MDFTPKINKIANLATGMDIYNLAQAATGKHAEVIAISEDQLLVGISKAIGVGQLITIELELPVSGLKVNVAATGKLIGALKHPDGNYEVTIELHSIEERPWHQYLSEAKAEQSRINQLLKVMKGDDE
jgi:hypothetical protein